jgi:hypothetical protein
MRTNNWYGQQVIAWQAERLRILGSPKPDECPRDIMQRELGLNRGRLD